MKSRIALVILGMLCMLHISGRTEAGFQDFLKDAMQRMTGEQGLSEAEIVSGLKEALRVGTGNAVETVSQTNGYFKNPRIKIPLPEDVQRIEKLLRTAGLGSQVDAFELSMNRAAERAAPEAKSIFRDAIRQMSFSDARGILQGSDDAATRYFEDKTRGRLQDVFVPIVHQAMSEVGTTRYYQDLNAQIETIPFADQMHFDLDRYVTAKALDGLFWMLAQEEQKIRAEPAARVTELLKKVFGTR